MTLPRGIRNDNPGNIRRSRTVWKGQRPVQSDPSFVQFQTMAYGVRAVCKVLLAYYHAHDLETVREIIERWAPPNENNTGAYVDAVASAVGVPPDAHLSADKQTLIKLCSAIIQHENGRGIDWGTVADGVALALA